MTGKGGAVLRSAAKQAGLTWLRCRRALKPSRDRRVLLLPPAAQSGSLGDEAMVGAVAGTLAHSEGSSVDLLVPDGRTTWPYLGLVGRQVQGIDLQAPLGAADRFRLHGLMSRYDGFYCLGADVTDGRYNLLQSVRMLKLLGEADRLGLDARLLGFSWSEEPHPRVIEAFKSLPPGVRVFVRDPVSYRRFSAQVPAQATPVADVAFLLDPEDGSPRIAEISDWARRQREQGGLLLGINISGHAFGLHDDEPLDRVTAGVAEAVKAVLNESPDLCVLAMPHDRRDVPGCGSDARAATALAQHLADRFGPRVAALSPEVSAGEIKAVAGQLDFVLTSRMHLAIAALGGGVPVACIPYMGKFEGLLEHFGLEGVTIQPERAVLPGEMAAFLAALLGRRDALRKQIEQRLPAVKAAARLNLQKEAS